MGRSHFVLDRSEWGSNILVPWAKDDRDDFSEAGPLSVQPRRPASKLFHRKWRAGNVDFWLYNLEARRYKKNSVPTWLRRPTQWIQTMEREYGVAPFDPPAASQHGPIVVDARRQSRLCFVN